MKLAACLVLMMACMADASGETLYRCVDAANHVSYQSAPCARGARLDGVTNYVPEPVAPSQRKAKPSRPPRPAHGVASSAGSIGSRRAPRRESDPCELAKQRRQAQLQRLGLKRTYDDLSRIDAAVWQACHGS